jgi:hypothetical protein
MMILFIASLLFVGLVSESRAAGERLFGVDATTDQLIVIDTATGVVTAIGPLGFGNVHGLAFRSDGTLFGLDVTGSDRLITIDPNTGAGSVVGNVGFGDVRGLSFSPSGILFGSDIASDQLITINTTTGLGTAVGPVGYSGVIGLAYRSDGVLFGANHAPGPDLLLTIDPATGASTVVGPLGTDPIEVQGLAFRSDGTLFGADLPTGQLITIDPTTGNVTYIGPLGSNDVSGLAFEPIFEVSIDIKPGSDPNSINACSRGLVSVAILATDTFSPANVIDPESCTLEGHGLAIRGKTRYLWSIEDVDGDGDDDLVLKFETENLELQEGPDELEVSCNAGDFVGSDSVNVVRGTDTCPDGS